MASKSKPLASIPSIYDGIPGVLSSTFTLPGGAQVRISLIDVTPTLAAMVNAAKLFSYANNIVIGFCRYGNKITLPQMRALLPQLPQLPAVAQADSPKCQIRSANYLGIIALAVHIKGLEKRVAKLFDMVTTGIGISSEHCPAHRIRARYYSQKSMTGSERFAIADYVADCVQAWCEERTLPTAKPTGTGMTWLRSRLPDTYAAMRKILGFKS